MHQRCQGFDGARDGLVARRPRYARSRRNERRARLGFRGMTDVAVVGPGAIGATFAAAAERAGHAVVAVRAARRPGAGRRAARRRRARARRPGAGRPVRRPSTCPGSCSPSRRTRPPAPSAGSSASAARARSSPCCRTASSTRRWSRRSPGPRRCCPRSCGAPPRSSPRAACVQRERAQLSVPDTHGGRGARRAARRARAGRPRRRLPHRGVAQAVLQRHRGPDGADGPARRGVPRGRPARARPPPGRGVRRRRARRGRAGRAARPSRRSSGGSPRSRPTRARRCSTTGSPAGGWSGTRATA